MVDRRVRRCQVKKRLTSGIHKLLRTIGKAALGISIATQRMLARLLQIDNGTDVAPGNC